MSSLYCSTHSTLARIFSTACLLDLSPAPASGNFLINSNTCKLHNTSTGCFKKVAPPRNLLEYFRTRWAFVDEILHSCCATHSLTAALDQLRVVASSTSNDPGPRSRQHQQMLPHHILKYLPILVHLSEYTSELHHLNY